jgi:UTP--glucose-1-phosphate uridylyltransferase
MWPASKVFPKELFPIGRFPVIAHVIWEMLEAGIDDITIIVRNDNVGAIEALLDPRTPPPDSVLNDDVVRQFEHMIRKVKFTFVQQNGPYGNGTPLLNGVRSAGEELCLFAFADDIILGENVSAGLIRTFQRTGHAVLAAQPVAEDEVRKFGVLECVQRDGIDYVARFLEKPKPRETASRLASLGRYLITKDVVRALEATPVGRDGELWLSDAFVSMLESGFSIVAFPLTDGKWYTVGTPEGLASAVQAAANVDRMTTTLQTSPRVS